VEKKRIKELGAVFRGMLTLLAGAGVAKLVALVSIPVLTRLYSPADYGLISLYVAVVTILGACLTLRYSLAIPLPKTIGGCANIFALSLGSMLVGLFLSALVLTFVGDVLFDYLGLESLIPWKWVVLIGAFGVSISEILNMWLTRTRRYRLAAGAQILQAVSGESAKVIFGFLVLGGIGLIAGHLVTVLAGAVFILIKQLEELLGGIKYIKLSRVVLLSKIYSGFPKFRLPSQLLLIFATQAPVLMVGRFFDVNVVGQLGLALMALALPVSLLGDTMGRAFYGEISHIGKTQPKLISDLTRSVVLRLVLLATPPALIIFFFSEEMFLVAFGGEWSLAGKLASVLSISLVFQFVQKPVSYIMFLYDGQKQLLYLNLQRAILVIASLWLGSSLYDDVVQVVLMYSVVLALHYIVSIYVAVRMIPVAVR